MILFFEDPFWVGVFERIDEGKLSVCKVTFIRTDNVILPNNAGELYFEEEDMDTFCDHLKKFDICYVHPLFEHRWGQRVVRFYDPDRHIIEVGEKLDAVILRFMEQGLSAKETAARMDIPFDFVKACLNKG